VQVITKARELKDLTVCEKNDSLSYTNDILGYKKLMPVDVTFTYTKEGILGDYSFSNVSFSKVNNTFVQNIVNEDIANLVTIGPLTTITQNSVDFCPNPDALPDYISKENMEMYLLYYTSNILSKEKYLNTNSNPKEDYYLSKLFLCDSSKNIGINICDMSRIQNISKLSKTVPTLSVDLNNIKWGNELDNLDISYLGEASLLYDNFFVTDGSSSYYIERVDGLINAIGTKKNINESTLCSSYKIFNTLKNSNKSFLPLVDFIKAIIFENIDKVSSPLCGEIISEFNIDHTGLYLKQYLGNHNNNSILKIYARCNNLNNFLK